MEDIEEASAPDTNKDRMVMGHMLQDNLGFSNAYCGTREPCKEDSMARWCPSPCLPIQKYMSGFFLFFVTKIIIC